MKVDLEIKQAFIVEGIVFDDLKAAQDHVIKAKLYELFNDLTVNVNLEPIILKMMQKRDQIAELLRPTPKKWEDKKASGLIDFDKIIKDMTTEKGSTVFPQYQDRFFLNPR